MAGTTTNRAYPYPTSGDAANIAANIQSLATAIDTDVNTLAPKASPTFTGTVAQPAVKYGYTTTATAAGTTTLTVASTFIQMFTGATTQTVVLPVTSTLTTGHSYEIHNNSTGALTVNSSGGNLVVTIPANSSYAITCIGTTLTTAADWDADWNGATTATGTGNVVLSASPTFTGAPLSTTAAVDTNTTQIATTAYVVGQGYAKLASPSLTGTPLSTTAAVDTNTTQIATTAYVLAQAAGTAPLIDGTATIGTSTRFARQDHIHPTDTSRAALASPSFTGTVSMSGPLFMTGGVAYLYQPTITTNATTGAQTLTVANLLTLIINYTGAGITTMTLPTGTLMDGGIAGIVSNVAFDWFIVNTTANIITMASGATNTYVGNTSIAANVSASFRSVRTAATTWSTYRIA